MHGWWGKRPTAEHQYRSWIGSWGSIDGARIVLAERAGDGEQVIASWPEGSYVSRRPRGPGGVRPSSRPPQPGGVACPAPSRDP
jgi:hypothetical protein